MGSLLQQVLLKEHELFDFEENFRPLEEPQLLDRAVARFELKRTSDMAPVHVIEVETLCIISVRTINMAQ